MAKPKDDRRPRPEPDDEMTRGLAEILSEVFPNKEEVAAIDARLGAVEEGVRSLRFPTLNLPLLKELLGGGSGKKPAQAKPSKPRTPRPKKTTPKPPAEQPPTNGASSTETPAPPDSNNPPAGPAQE